MSGVGTYDLLPPLAQQELDALRESIRLDGVRDPIWVDEDGNTRCSGRRSWLSERVGLQQPISWIRAQPTAQ